MEAINNHTSSMDKETYQQWLVGEMERVRAENGNGHKPDAPIATPLRYDLASGQNRRDGFTGVDVAGTPDIIFDLLTFPWTFATDDSVDELHCSHFFEHIPSGTTLDNPRFKFMDECYRIMKVGAKMTIICPYYSSMRASQDPSHQWPPISEASFLYMNRGWREMNKLDHYNVKCDFDFAYSYAIDNEWASRAQEARDFAVKHYANVVNDIIVVLTKRG